MATSVSPPPPSPSTPSGPPASAATSKIFLLVAVLLGLLATILAFFFINTAAGGGSGPDVEIVVARHDLSPNQIIDPARDLKVEKWPSRNRSQAGSGLNPAALNEIYKGEHMNRKIFQGQPILLADIAAVGDLTLEKPYYALFDPRRDRHDHSRRPRENHCDAIKPGPGHFQHAGARRNALRRDDHRHDPGFKVLAVGGGISSRRASRPLLPINTAALGDKQIRHAAGDRSAGEGDHGRTRLRLQAHQGRPPVVSVGNDRPAADATGGIAPGNGPAPPIPTPTSHPGAYACE